MSLTNLNKNRLKSTQFKTLLKDRIHKQSINANNNSMNYNMNNISVCLQQLLKKSNMNLNIKPIQSISSRKNIDNNKLKKYIRNNIIKKNPMKDNSVINSYHQSNTIDINTNININKYNQIDDDKISVKSINSTISIKSTKSSRLLPFNNNKIRSNKIYNNISKPQLLQQQSQTQQITPSHKSLSKSRSSYISRSFSRNQVILPKQQQLQIHQNRIDKLNKLEQRLDTLTQNKLGAFMINNTNLCNNNTNKSFQPLLKKSQLFSNSFSSSFYKQKPSYLQNRLSTEQYQYQQQQQNQLLSSQNLLNKQIQSILQSINNLKQNTTYANKNNLNVNVDEEIINVNKKIQILQKLMATSYTESEILKNYYFALKSQKYPYLSRKDKLLNVIAKRRQILKSNNYSQKKPKLKRPLVKLQTTSNYYYNAPPVTAYLKQNSSKHSSFILNRQPLPRSMYNRQFLNYGTLPSFNYKPHDQAINSSLSSNKQNLTSSYQQNYKQTMNSHIKQIDYKELDCYKNKVNIAPKIVFKDMYKTTSQGMSQAGVMNKKNNNKNIHNNNNKQKVIINQIKNDHIIKNITNINPQQSQPKLKKTQHYLRNTLQDEPFTVQKPLIIGESEMKRQFTCWNNFNSNNENKVNQKQQNKRHMLLTSLSKNGNLNKLKANYKMQFVR